MLRRSVLHHVPLLLFLLSIYFLPSPSNPFNAKSGQSQRATKLPNFILQCIGKVPSESISSRRDSQIYSISNLHSVAKLCYDSHDSTYNLPKIASWSWANGWDMKEKGLKLKNAQIFCNFVEWNECFLLMFSGHFVPRRKCSLHDSIDRVSTLKLKKIILTIAPLFFVQLFTKSWRL